MYLRVPADPAIAAFVEAIWVQHDERDARQERFQPTRVLPSGKTDLIFHYADPFAERGPDGRAQVLADVTVCGQRTRPVDVEATGRTGLVIVSFQPWGLGALVGDQVAELTDRSVDAAAFLPPAPLRALGERLREAGGAGVRVALIRGFLGECLARARRDERVETAAVRIAESGGRLPVEALAREARLSRAELSRRFRRRIGVGPKRFADVVRFQRAVERRRTGASWSAVAHDCGYYDQSHLIRSFAAYSGHTFGRFPVSPAAPLGDFFNRPDSSHFYNTVYL